MIKSLMNDFGAIHFFERSSSPEFKSYLGAIRRGFSIYYRKSQFFRAWAEGFGM